MSHYSESDLHRPPDWRWRQANYLVDNNLRLPRALSDSGIGELRRFIRALREIEHPIEHYSLKESFPAIYAAWEIFDRDDLRSIRWDLEARLLAAQPIGEIQRTLSMTRLQIETFARMFFDVADRLDSKGVISHIVIGPATRKGLTEREPDGLWKLFGYWGGPKFLDFLIYRFNEPRKPTNSREIADFIADDAEQTLQLRAMIALRSMKLDWQTQTELINLYFRMIELRQASGAGQGAAREALKSGVQAFLDGIPWTRGGDTISGIARLDEIDRTGIGLRADELMQIGQGGATPELDRVLTMPMYPSAVSQGSENS